GADRTGDRLRPDSQIAFNQLSSIWYNLQTSPKRLSLHILWGLFFGATIGQRPERRRQCRTSCPRS
ncbi:MAG: hypothetical protein ACRC1L_12795, partial [Prochlorococcaceae cyanobacterium]